MGDRRGRKATGPCSSRYWHSLATSNREDSRYVHVHVCALYIKTRPMAIHHTIHFVQEHTRADEMTQTKQLGLFIPLVNSPYPTPTFPLLQLWVLQCPDGGSDVCCWLLFVKLRFSGLCVAIFLFSLLSIAVFILSTFPATSQTQDSMRVCWLFPCCYVPQKLT